MSTPSVRTTLALPADLLRALDRAVEEGKARSRNDFVAAAVRHELAALERPAIDAAFLAMADDAEYQAEAQSIADEFALTDVEAFRLGEAEP
jgi:metal-responsive CopG/Arc/MetJ family transcriptional regulator